MALSHATDSLHLLRRAALRGEGNALELATSPYGAFPLLRAGLEGATLALWLLGPSSRAERVRRRMVMHVMDARNEDQAVGNFGASVALGARAREPQARAQAMEVLNPLLPDSGSQNLTIKQWRIVETGASALVVRRAARPRAVFVALAVVACLVSFASPIGAATTTSAAVWLSAMHVAVLIGVVPPVARALPSVTR